MTQGSAQPRVAFDPAGAIEFRVERLVVGALCAAELCQPDVIVMDASSSFPLYIQLFRSARTLERLDHIPILAALDDADTDSIARTIDAGADDCLTAHLESPDSMARIRAATRRATSQPDRSTIRYADLTFDKTRLKVSQKGRNIPLTVLQMRLLEFLMTHPGEVFTRRQLLDHVWGKESTDEGAVTACISRIRRALGQDHGDGLIRSVRGAGYALDDEAGELPLRHTKPQPAAFFKL
jgi:two-component system phosphate regulon response regulator PhoB